MTALTPYFRAATPLGLAFWVTAAAWFVYVTALLGRERAGRADASTSRLLLACTVGGLGLAFLAAFFVPAASIAGPVPSVLGLVVVWAGLALGDWGRRSLGRHYHPVVAIDDAHQVVRDGPYRVVRHPIYAGRLLSLAGLGLAMTNGLSLAACVIVPLYGFAVRIRVEEQAMVAATGGGYAAYRKRTWRLIPGVW